MNVVPAVPPASSLLLVLVSVARLPLGAETSDHDREKGATTAAPHAPGLEFGSSICALSRTSATASPTLKPFGAWIGEAVSGRLVRLSGTAPHAAATTVSEAGADTLPAPSAATAESP